ncbi:MAG: hypothetical protein DWQ18_05240 [Crenarchaeota archaeon]|nr:MAG: hypothetical protein DWQ17_07890 [Thermoproteota archaeon]RDJ34290.1 MAG: hypothetical protein DWQ18_05240 [Thermoproteota archaeon]RDJ36598.1 MAG: hypothetical protein DWQ13_05370 [Thermoproteota archaeon]RDJ37873.1 MAG: hypothetical protein DWQ19_05465 [Thermoproteota archaeon]
MMNPEELSSHLEYFGLDQVDSKIYMGLLQLGSISVGTMAAKLEIDRGKAYRSLNKLKNFGIVTTTFSNPTICTAVEPKTALASIIERHDDEITTMKNLAKKLTEQLSTVTKTAESPDITSLSIIQGRTNVYSRIGKMIQSAKNQVYIMTTIEDLTMMYHTSIPEKISLAKKNGVDVNILTQLNNDKDYPLIHRLNSSDVKLGKLPSKSRIIVECDRQLIMSGAISDAVNLKDEGDSILFTNSSEMVNNMFSLCSLLWKKSKKLELSVISQRE